MRRPPRHISSWSWPAAGTRPSALLTARVPCRPGPSSCPTDPTTQRAALWVTPLTPLLLVSAPQPASDRSHSGNNDHSSESLTEAFPFILFACVFRAARTWRGWRIGCSFTRRESETSSSWADSASTTTGYRWRRRYSSRRCYRLLKTRDITEWSFNVQRKPYWSARQASVHLDPVNWLSVGRTGASLIKVSCGQTKLIPVPSRFFVIRFLKIMIQCVKAL